MNREGKLLIAHPRCPEDSYFHKSVIYLYQDHPKIGSIGLMLNKPSTITLKNLSEEQLHHYENINVPVFHGGPVNQQALVLLHSDEWTSTNSSHVGPGLMISSDEQMIKRLSYGDEPKLWRIFGGFCGWQPRQLDLELAGTYPFKAENSWLLVNPTTDLIFKYTGNNQWKTAVDLSSQQLFEQYF